MGPTRKRIPTTLPNIRRAQFDYARAAPASQTSSVITAMETPERPAMSCAEFAAKTLEVRRARRMQEAEAVGRIKKL